LTTHRWKRSPAGSRNYRARKKKAWCVLELRQRANPSFQLSCRRCDRTSCSYF
jgi:hypothetical protein